VRILAFIFILLLSNISYGDYIVTKNSVFDNGLSIYNMNGVLVDKITLNGTIVNLKNIKENIYVSLDCLTYGKVEILGIGEFIMDNIPFDIAVGENETYISNVYNGEILVYKNLQNTRSFNIGSDNHSSRLFEYNNKLFIITKDSLLIFGTINFNVVDKFYIGGVIYNTFKHESLLYVVKNNEVIVFDLNVHKFVEKYILSKTCTTIYVDKNIYVVAGGNTVINVTNGLKYVFPPVIKQEDGFIGINFVYDIIVKDGVLFAAESNGITYLDMRSGYRHKLVDKIVTKMIYVERNF